MTQMAKKNHEEGSNSLPEDVLTEILSCLPVKSLLRFMCVSKSWHALIRSPNFVNRHLTNEQCGETVCVKRHIVSGGCDGHDDDLCLSIHDPNSAHLSMLSQDVSIIHFLQNPSIYTDIARDVRLLGASNGIVCLRCHDILILCNPSLREVKRLPPRPWAFSFPAKDYRDAHICFGYGYDNVSSSYKVVFVYYVQRLDEEYDDTPIPINSRTRVYM